jgi:hypothetical protein
MAHSTLEKANGNHRIFGKKPKGLRNSAGDKLFFDIIFFAFSVLYTIPVGEKLSLIK